MFKSILYKLAASTHNNPTMNWDTYDKAAKSTWNTDKQKAESWKKFKGRVEGYISKGQYDAANKLLNYAHNQFTDKGYNFRGYRAPVFSRKQGPTTHVSVNANGKTYSGQTPRYSSILDMRAAANQIQRDVYTTGMEQGRQIKNYGITMGSRRPTMSLMSPAQLNKYRLRLTLYNKAVADWRKQRAAWRAKPDNAGKKYAVARPVKSDYFRGKEAVLREFGNDLRYDALRQGIKYREDPNKLDLRWAISPNAPVDSFWDDLAGSNVPNKMQPASAKATVTSPVTPAVAQATPAVPPKVRPADIVNTAKLATGDLAFDLQQTPQTGVKQSIEGVAKALPRMAVSDLSLGHIEGATKFNDYQTKAQLIDAARQARNVSGAIRLKTIGSSVKEALNKYNDGYPIYPDTHADSVPVVGHNGVDPLEVSNWRIAKQNLAIANQKLSDLNAFLNPKLSFQAYRAHPDALNRIGSGGIYYDFKKPPEEQNIIPTRGYNYDPKKSTQQNLIDNFDSLDIQQRIRTALNADQDTRMKLAVSSPYLQELTSGRLDNTGLNAFLSASTVLEDLDGLPNLTDLQELIRAFKADPSILQKLQDKYPAYRFYLENIYKKGLTKQARIWLQSNTQPGVFNFKPDWFYKSFNPLNDPMILNRLKKNLEETQKARAASWGHREYKYKPGDRQTIPGHVFKIGETIYNSPAYRFLTNPAYQYIIDAKQRAYAYDGKSPGVIPNLSRHSATLMHLLGHNSSWISGDPGTNDKEMVINPHFSSGDDASYEYQTNPGMRFTHPRAQLPGTVVRGANPANYYNSAVLMTTAMGNQKRLLARLGHSVWDKKDNDFIDKFTTAMLDSGIWAVSKPNPKYPNKPMYYRRAHVPIDTNMHRDQINLLLTLNLAIMNHFNRYRQLLSISNKTKKQQELFEHLKKVLPGVIQVSHNKSNNWKYGPVAQQSTAIG